MPKKKGNKFGAVKCEYNGIKFNSLMERDFYKHLLDIIKDDITNIEFEPKFTLLPTFEYMGQKVKPITYKADFLITYKGGLQEVIEIKGFEARDWPLRKKLFEYNNPDKVLTVYTQCPIKYGGGFILLSELKKLRAAEKRRKTKEKKEKGEIL